MPLFSSGTDLKKTSVRLNASIFSLEKLKNLCSRPNSSKVLLMLIDRSQQLLLDEEM